MEAAELDPPGRAVWRQHTVSEVYAEIICLFLDANSFNNGQLRFTILLLLL